MKHKRQAAAHHHQSLADQIEDPESYGVRTKPHKKARRKEDDTSAPDGGTIEPEQSAAILSLAREQQEAETMEASRSAMGLHTGAVCKSSTYLRHTGL
jgi:hypothetical protein